jgi:hypothetical protein
MIREHSSDVLALSLFYKQWGSRPGESVKVQDIGPLRFEDPCENAGRVFVACPIHFAQIGYLRSYETMDAGSLMFV